PIHLPVLSPKCNVISLNEDNDAYEIALLGRPPSTIISDGNNGYYAQYVTIGEHPYGVYPFYDETNGTYDYYIQKYFDDSAWFQIHRDGSSGCYYAKLSDNREVEWLPTEVRAVTISDDLNGKIKCVIPRPNPVPSRFQDNPQVEETEISES